MLLAALAAVLAWPAAASAFVPNDTLAPRQWYLERIRAFDAWPDLPLLPPVRVAVIDSGIDAKHPELAGRIVGAETFVGGSPLTDEDGHGTFVAGEIAAATDNNQGIAGLAPSARLLVAKVVGRDGTILPSAEADAIRWAVDNGARVINLSLGGTRDPNNPTQDTFSALEQSAIDYAVRRNVVVVAAVGNGDESPTTPWPFASYPAALPHVIGVSAFGPLGSVPEFSNRDPVLNDISAPGEDIVSTFPRALTARYATCEEQGYSLCAPPVFRRGDGTSFAAPQVSAAAALLLSMRPKLTADQVAELLERSADDATPDDGCRSCRLGRDALTGWGRLDIAAALKAVRGPVPAPDRLEPNDEAGGRARKLSAGTLRATLDFWDDRVDVYKIRLRRKSHVTVRLKARSDMTAGLSLWRPATRRVEGRAVNPELRVASSRNLGSSVRLDVRIRTGGWYFVEAKLARPGTGGYALSVSKS
jgi:subtilisin family serine protease